MVRLDEVRNLQIGSLRGTSVTAFLIQSQVRAVTVALLSRGIRVIFGFSNFVPKLKSVPKTRCAPEVQGAAPAGDFGQRAKIYDLAHERRLRALSTYIEQGYTLSEAARLLGVSMLTVCRWDDHGRR